MRDFFSEAGEVFAGSSPVHPASFRTHFSEKRSGFSVSKNGVSGNALTFVDGYFWMPKLIEVDIRRFPYGIYYTIENEVVVIWAVKHLHRDPDYWRERRS